MNILRPAFLFLAVSSCILAYAQPSLPLRGPLPVRDLEPLNTPFLLPVPAAPTVLQNHQTRLEMQLESANHLANFGDGNGRFYITDFEEQRLTVDYARGLGSGQIGIRVPLVARNRGLFDAIIRRYDNFLGQESNGRENVPDFRNLFIVTDDAGNSIIDRRRSSIGLGDIVLEYRRNLTAPVDDAPQGRRFALGARALLKLPTGSGSKLIGSGGLDFGAGLMASLRPLKRVGLHANLNYLHLGNPHIDTLDVRSNSLQYMIGVEFVLNRKTSALVQVDANKPPARGPFGFGGTPRRLITFGAWHQLNVRDQLFASFSENAVVGSTFGSAPDIAVAIGLRRTR